MTQIAIAARPAWVLADLEADPADWSLATVRARAEAERLDLTAERAGLLADVLVPALRAARREEVTPALLMFLLPEAGQPSVCSVSVRVEAVEESVGTGELLNDLKLPEEMLEQPALLEYVETLTGPAIHLVQRYRTPVDAEREAVQEHEVFFWHLATEDAHLAVYLSTSYLDLVQAGQWRAELLALAASLEVGAEG